MVSVCCKAPVSKDNLEMFRKSVSEAIEAAKRNFLSSSFSADIQGRIERDEIEKEAREARESQRNQGK